MQLYIWKITSIYNKLIAVMHDITMLGKQHKDVLNNNNNAG